MKIACQHLLKDVLYDYQKFLIENEAAMQYLKNRGFTMSLIQEFKLGFCSGSIASILSKQLAKYNEPDRQLLKKELIESGLLAMNYSTGDLIERFVGYIVIPEFDNSGNIVKIFGQLIDNKTCSDSLVASNKEVIA